MATKKKIEEIKPLYEAIQETGLSTSKRILDNRIIVKFKKLNEDAEIPTYAHDGDIGMDIKCTDIEYDKINDRFIYHTGLACETAKGIGCYLMPRSSQCKTEVYQPNSIGLIDTYTYRGEICMIVKNRTSIEVSKLVEAIDLYYALPWYQRLFTPFKKILNAYKDLSHDIPPYAVGDKIGQLVFFKAPIVSAKEVDVLSETERGTGGFGSTGR
ncbi:MAG: hypothetical protein IKU29_04195 [Parabacteroides sp.]|nr:hypothetical protein [Parabacteroides sp.]